MPMTGPSGASAYLDRYKNDPCEIDDILASLVRKGYLFWDAITEEFSLTQKGVLETHEGTIH